MSDENLAKYLKQLEERIGKERVRALRAEAIKRGISIQQLLAEAANSYADAILQTEEAA